MPLPLIALAAPAIVNSAYKFFTGSSQKKEAERIAAANQRPTKSVQQEYLNNQSLAAFNAANKRLPGYGMLENRLAAAQGRAVGGAIDSQRDPASVAAVLSASQGNYDKAIEDLGVQGANFQRGNQQIAYGMNTALAQQKDAAWDWNSKQKYLSAMAAASALRNAGGQNQAGAFNEVADIGTSMLFNKMGGAGAAGSSYGQYDPAKFRIPTAGQGQYPLQNPTSQGARYANNPYGAYNNLPDNYVAQDNWDQNAFNLSNKYINNPYRR